MKCDSPNRHTGFICVQWHARIETPILNAGPCIAPMRAATARERDPGAKHPACFVSQVSTVGPLALPRHDSDSLRQNDPGAMHPTCLPYDRRAAVIACGTEGGSRRVATV
jgi:hypothetical protein